MFSVSMFILSWNYELEIPEAQFQVPTYLDSMRKTCSDRGMGLERWPSSTNLAHSELSMNICGQIPVEIDISFNYCNKI